MACDIDKPLATHWARRTCGMLMLNKGYSIEVVAKVLGHSDIKTTQHCYAKILDIYSLYTKILEEKIQTDQYR